MTDRKLKELRAKIDETDRQILELLAGRLKLADQLGQLKKKLGMKIRDLKREREIVKIARARAKRLGLDPDLVESFMFLAISQALGREVERVGGIKMWARVQEAFAGHPAQLSVASVLFKYGLRVREDGEVACGAIRIPAVQIAQEAGVDRRMVDATAQTILQRPELREIFENLQPIAYLKGVAQQLGLGVIEILPVDAASPGTISEVSGVISKFGISIRQAVADDPYFVAQPKLTLITDEPVTGEVIEVLRKLRKVQSVIVY